MLLKEINTSNFKPFGILPKQSVLQKRTFDLYQQDVRTSSVLWYYPGRVFVIPEKGVGVIFIRAVDGTIHRFLLEQPICLDAGIEFCILPYEESFSYQLSADGERQQIPIAAILSATGFIPNILAKNLYSVRYREKEKQITCQEGPCPYWELIFVTKGTMICESDNQSFELKQGQMVFFAPHRPHRRRSEYRTSASFLTVTFDGDMVHIGSIANRPIYADELCHNLIRNIIEEDSSGEFYSDDMILALITRLVITVLRNIRSDTIVTRIPSSLKVEISNNYILDCLDIIHRSITETITLPGLAKKLNLSPSYLSSLFKQQVGRSISEYVRLVRLEKVKDMIGEGRYTIAQISEIMGYCSPTYLSTEFKREFHISPKEYARSLE